MDFFGPSFPNFGAMVFRGLEAELPNYKNSLGILSHEISRNMPTVKAFTMFLSIHNTKQNGKQHNCMLKAAKVCHGDISGPMLSPSLITGS